ncbi:proton channel OTOP2-like [Acipenser oxyrinchus oxyrinchus]|uniref:Proton channel OTOP2-like n=1 Tax=Acipenser oxyrinchus oxyrinchus TaxID=40147 RepID=A0AAD8D4D1_ACIOX|nr:proton channel OTOP2-like [Acipenser oxyrinchus oxyrinchus]
MEGNQSSVAAASPNGVSSVPAGQELAMQTLSYSSQPPSPNTPSTPHQQSRNSIRLLSGILAVNILLLGSALVCGAAFSKVKVLSDEEIHIYLTILLILTTAWMIFYMVHTASRTQAVLYKDSHAGPIWLRGGLVLFGVASLIMDVFKTGFSTGKLNCESPVKVTFPLVQLVFVVVQTYFLWVHSKDCVQKQSNITGCGLMLTLATNLMLWMSAVTDESLHQTREEASKPNGSFNHLRDGSMFFKAGRSGCECTHSACEIFEKGFYYLYPFNIEYSLFASAMTYVMWKNIGREIDDCSPHKISFRTKGVVFGVIVGLLVVIAGLGVFVVYEVEVTGDASKERVLIMYYTFSIVGLSLMSLASLAGSIIYRFDKRTVVSTKNPTRSLDVALLLGAALGQFLISYFSIVAIVAEKATRTVSMLNLTCSCLIILQLCLQNLFIIEGLHKQPYHAEPPVVSVVFINEGTSRSNPYSPSLKNDNDEPSPAENSLELSSHSHDFSSSTHSSSSHLSWKRRALKEISGFLLLCNVIFWIIPAFGARPQFENGLEEWVYGFSMWVAIVNIGLPFGIFYRMHSVASLFEVYLTS